MDKTSSKNYDMSVKFEATYGGFEYIGLYITLDRTMTCMNLYSHQTKVFHKVISTSKAEKLMGKFMEEN